MIALERILLPTDFSDYSRQAIQYACELAKQFDATIHVLHIVEPITLAMPSPGSALPQELLADAEQSAKEQSDQWISREAHNLEVVQSVRRGVPFLEILRYAKDNNIGLIVMATHGRTGLEHALIGSVAERVVRKAPCPVLTVRPEGHQFLMP